MTDPRPSKAAQSTADTRSRLIEAGLLLFGQTGFEGTSTRALARKAETNVASIAYHFGGKEGLRDACVAAIAERIETVWGSDEVSGPPPDPEAATAEIERVLRGLVGLMVAAPEARHMVAFVVRDMTGPGAVADMLYAQVVEGRHRALCRLWAVATGRDPEDADVKLAVFAAIGQIFYFNLALPLVARRMGWDTVGPEEAGQIADTAVLALRAAIERHRR